ncbi:MAG: chromosome segregation protein SMC [Alphaproteobacteria bacterium]|nr:chromosome segregation protein SMC [Alphaproteobacteria bacterium]
MHFSRLQVTGFKSFVDTTELYIEPGMTGVIGPNGCGKSNVVEALRWVMGETSPKSMRGGEMEDVIFGGTASRPSRNIAEVVLRLDNADRTAPAAFNDSEEIEVSRRIERGAGSQYRINGKEVRARDVQLLFADLASGAHSTAMVSQGRIGALIGAKPTERRVLLEEAAGIRGLHSRRHEAELRLRAAETNLSRLDDVIEALEGQHQGLQRQARQAVRYRRLSENIRKHEAVLLHLRWQESTKALEAAQVRLREAEAEVNGRTETAGAAATRQAEVAALLPDLRQKETEAAAELQRLLLARNELEREETRLTEAQAEVERRHEQITSDIEREGSLAADAQTAITRLETEAGAIDSALASETETETDAKAALETVTVEVDTKDTELNELMAAAAQAEVRRSTLERQRDQLWERIEKLKHRASEMEDERVGLAAEIADDSTLEAIRNAIGAAEQQVEKARETATVAESAFKKAQGAETLARDNARDIEAERGRINAEIRALAELVDPAEGDFFAPLIESIAVEPGYEAALGVALGEDIEAPIDTAAPVYWAILPALSVLQNLPDKAKPLAQFVKGPPALSRRLSQIGVVDDDTAGEALHANLRPGQRLVSREGSLWRWDGYRVSAGAPTPAATRLGQRNRLNALREKLAAMDPDFNARQAALDVAKRDREEAESLERKARQTLNEAFTALNEARQAFGDVSGEAAAAQSRLAALADAANQAAFDLNEAELQWKSTRQAIDELEDPDARQAVIDRLRAELGELRADQSEKRSAYDRLARESEERTARRHNVSEEQQTWQNRLKGASERLADLEARSNAAETDRATLAVRPAEIETQRNALLGAISEAETRRGTAADALASGEAAQNEADAALRSTEASLAESREQRVRCEAQVEQSTNDSAVIRERIAERLSCEPDAVLREAGIPEDEELPEPEAVDIKLGRFTRERDNMGPVNLRAEIEAQELETQIASMQGEREDLVAAIARLRQGIGQLNREGRERLLAAFETVNTHFQELFVKLFGGGRAYLTLTEADDPLEAGLEIMASPPGKKLQVMSLLSGGEQALTAISLLFGVFLTNPAPICVLDEVDAPLDDANVDRFCALLGDIAHSSDTRFLVITHHRITMARMDRLFGVTMGERGVSQLVSVDLQRAQELRATA